MKGIVLAGGTGSRLWPITRGTSKQLLPIYDKPMIYYPISTLMLAGIREILIITTPHDQLSFKSLLGDGSDLGLIFKYAVQPKPEGLAQALLIGESFLDGDDCLLILGDNIFHGVGLGKELKIKLPTNGAQIFTYEVADPTQYGIITMNDQGLPTGIEEKPINSESNLAITGLYFFDGQETSIAKGIKPSHRGELEIVSVLQEYLNRGQLRVTELSRGTAWLDTGNPNAMHDASTYIRVIEERTGLKIACLEEIAFKSGLISSEKMQQHIERNSKNQYGAYLAKIAK